MYIWRPGQLPTGQTAKARSGYRVQSLRMGRDRQCKTYPIYAVPSELVKIAPPLYTAVGMRNGAQGRTRDRRSQDGGSAQEAEIAGFRGEAGAPGSRCSNVIRQKSGPLLGSCIGKKWGSRCKGGSLPLASEVTTCQQY
jgi:hypothetical protein